MEFILVVAIVAGVFFLIKRLRGPLLTKPTTAVTGGGGSGEDEEKDKTTQLAE